MKKGLLDRARFGRIHFQAFEAHAELEKIALSTKRNNYLTFLEYLFDLGRQTADAWLADKGPAIGQGSTIDLQKLLPVGARLGRDRAATASPHDGVQQAPRQLTISLACETGIALDPLLRSAGLCFGQIDQPNARIGVASQIRFLELAAKALRGIHCSGSGWFRVARDGDLRQMGLLY
jgi:hypothetical protein